MATSTKDRPKSSTQDDDTVSTKARQREAREKAQAKEREAKAKEKAKAEREKEKAREAKAKEKAKAERQKEKEREAKAKEKAKAERQKEKERRAKAEEKAKAGRAEEPRQGATSGRPAAKSTAARRSSAGTGPRGRTGTSRPEGGSPRPTVHEKGWIAEELGKADAVSRSTKRPTLAASFTTRDHDVIRRWAESRGGVPADVRGTGDGNSTGGAGVLRIEFRDDADRLEDVGWDAFFATFEDSDVDFLYQEFTKDGGESRFHKIVRADS